MKTKSVESSDPLRLFSLWMLLLLAFLFMLRVSVAVAQDLPVGTWDQPCRAGVTRTEVITETHATLLEVFHREVDCKTPKLLLVSEGALSWSETSPETGTPEGARAIDFRFESVAALFSSDSGAKMARDAVFCGLSDWQKDRLVMITGLSCEFVPGQKPWQVPSDGDERFGVYRTVRSADRVTLQWGKMTRERNGTSPSLRPSDWDPQVYSLRRKLE